MYVGEILISCRGRCRLTMSCHCGHLYLPWVALYHCGPQRCLFFAPPPARSQKTQYSTKFARFVFSFLYCALTLFSFICVQDQCVTVMYSNVGGVIAHQSTYVRGKKKEVRDASKEELSKEAARESAPITTRLLSFLRRRINPPPGKPTLITFAVDKVLMEKSSYCLFFWWEDALWFLVAVMKGYDLFIKGIKGLYISVPRENGRSRRSLC